MIDLIRGKKVVGFGASRSIRNLAEQLNVEIEYYVDNNRSMWGKPFVDAVIRDPSCLLEEDRNQLFVLVLSSFYEEIGRQLAEMGLVEHVHYCHVDHIRHELQSRRLGSLYNDVRILTPGDYDSVIREMGDYLKESFRFVSLYTFGDFGSPSISDIDLLIVVDHPVNELHEVKNRIERFIGGELLRNYLFYHSPVVINQRMWEHLPLFHTAKALMYRDGEPLDIPVEQFQREKTLIWNYSFYRYFKTFMQKNKLGSREFCLITKNMQHSLENNRDHRDKDAGLAIQAREIVRTIREEALANKMHVEKVQHYGRQLIRLIELSEGPEFKYFRETGTAPAIKLFPDEYRQLYEETRNGNNEFAQEMNRALRELGHAYNEVQSLFGAMPIFDNLIN